MTASSAPAAAIPSAPSSTLSPNAAPFTPRARPVCAPPGPHQDGDTIRLIDDNLMLPAACFGMKSGDAVYPASAYGMHQSQPSSSLGIVKEYPSSASSTSGYTWMASELQEQFPLTSGNGRSGNKSTKVTIKCPPNRAIETNNIGSGCKSKLAVRENDDCNNETGKDIPFCRNFEFNSPANDNNGSSQGTVELNPTLKPLRIPSTGARSHISVADDVNPDPSECSVDSPCWPGTLASRVSAPDVRQTSDAWSVKQKLVEFDAGKGSPVQDTGACTEIENLVASKSKQNHSQPHVESGLSKKSKDVDTDLENNYHGKELEHAEPGAGQCNVERTHRLEVRKNCIKRSVLNSAAPDFIPSSVQKSSSGNGLPSSIFSHGSCSSTGRSISEILKEIKSQSDLLQNNYSDDIKLEDQDISLLESIIETLQISLDKGRKGLVKVASDKAGQKASHSQNAVSKSVAANQNAGASLAVFGQKNMADCTHFPGDFGRNSLTGYQPAPDNFRKELFSEDEHSQVLIFKNLWIDAERANCALKYQLKQTRLAMDLESNIAHNGGGPRNPPFQLCDMVTDPSSSLGLALTCPPTLKDHPGARKTPNIIYVANDIHSGDNNVRSRSKDCVLKNIQAEHFMSNLEESSIRRLQLAPNKSHEGLNSSISDGVPSHSYITRRDDILSASSEFGLLDWEHVLKDEIA